MKAEILTVGDELLRGEILDLNKSFLAERLLEIGIETHWQTSVRDDCDAMIDAFRNAAKRSDVVLVSGGLGPTRDDLTSEALAQAFGRKLVFDAASLQEIERYFAELGRKMAESNAKQAYFPEDAEILQNSVGTAPGFCLREGKSWFFCLPGVPTELMSMMHESVLPRLKKQSVLQKEVSKTILLRTFGMGESLLEDMLADCFHEEGVTLGFRTAFPENFLRLSAKAPTLREAQERLERAKALLLARLGDVVCGDEKTDLESIVVALLRKSCRTLSVAESCTGGLIAQRLTSVPGASEVFWGGVVAYANAAKERLLGVDFSLLAEHGAVSAPVARAMAEGVRKQFSTHFGVASTGISGPGGGSAEKPQGLAYVALASDGGETQVRSFCAAFERSRHRFLTSQVALDGLRRQLLGLEWNLNFSGGVAQAPD